VFAVPQFAPDLRDVASERDKYSLQLDASLCGDWCIGVIWLKYPWTPHFAFSLRAHSVNFVIEEGVDEGVYFLVESG